MRYFAFSIKSRKNSVRSETDRWHKRRMLHTDLVNPSALNSQFVLIDGDDLFILQDRFILRSDCSQVGRHEQRGGKYSPYGHLHLALFVAQTEVADDQLQEKRACQRLSLSIVSSTFFLVFDISFLTTRCGCLCVCLQCSNWKNKNRGTPRLEEHYRFLYWFNSIRVREGKGPRMVQDIIRGNIFSV